MHFYWSVALGIEDLYPRVLKTSNQLVSYLSPGCRLSALVQSSCASKLCTDYLIPQVTLSQVGFSEIETETEISTQGVYKELILESTLTQRKRRVQNFLQGEMEPELIPWQVLELRWLLEEGDETLMEAFFFS